MGIRRQSLPNTGIISVLNVRQAGFLNISCSPVLIPTKLCGVVQLSKNGCIPEEKFQNLVVLESWALFRKFVVFPIIKVSTLRLKVPFREILLHISALFFTLGYTMTVRIALNQENVC